MLTRNLLFLSLLIGASGVRAGEVLVAEDFEKFDLSPPQTSPWGVLNNKGEISLADEAGHGKVLKISAKGDNYPNVTYVLPLERVRGQTLKVSVACKFPGNYKPIADKAWARPKLQIHIKDKTGNSLPDIEEIPKPSTPDWQMLQHTFDIDKDASMVQVYLRVDLVVADVLFDNLNIEMLSAGNPGAPATAAPGALPGGPNPSVNTPAAGDAAKAAKAPKKSIEDGGILFSPELAGNLQKNVKPGATQYSIAYVGPGLPMKELEKKVGKWTLAPGAKELAGPTATPRQLLAVLPDFLHKNKPEVVFLIAETGPRKPTSTEQYDWEDLARLCTRMGATPILAMPGAQTGADTKEELRNAMSAAATSAQCPLVEIKAPGVAFKRVTEVASLLDKYVYCRTPLEEKAGGPDEKE